MVVILLADGFEELEALSPLDILLREGIETKTVGITGKYVTGTHGIEVRADLLPEEVDLDKIEGVIFPGGMPGALNLDASDFTDIVIEAGKRNGAHFGAICAAPLVLGRRGMLKGHGATCYPGFEGELTGASLIDAPVVTSGNITTARSYEAAFAFGKELAEILRG